MRNNKRIKQSKALLTRKIKTYKPEEILAAGGADVFGKKIGQNPKEAIKKLMSVAITEEEFQLAIQNLNDSK